MTEALAEAVGPAHVLLDDDVRAGYERDWTGRFGGQASAIVRPADTHEVARVLRACADHGVAVVPQGGNSGLVGGGVPRGGEVVVSMRRLDGVGEVDRAAAQVEAGAGATIARVQEAAARHALAFPVDFAARETATVGGAIATDAGGIRAFRHGTMRRQVVGLEAVLADGAIVRRLSGLTKDDAGYDLPSLFVGSEGTLAIVTRARLRLVPEPARRVVALVGLPDVAHALALLERLRLELPALDAVELMLRDGVELTLAHLRTGEPIAPAPVYLLVECAGDADPLDALATVLGDAAGVRDTAIADDRRGREALWALREAHTEAVARAGVAHKLDVAVPVARVGELIERARELLARLRPDARCIAFAHLADGNVHLNVLGLAPDDVATDMAVLELVARLGGTIAAEHGVGIAKADALQLTRSPAELAAMRAIKRALDPAGLLNPGVILSREA